MVLVVPSAAIGAALALDQQSGATEHLRIPLGVRLTRTGRAIRLVHGNGTLATGGEDDTSALLRLIARAHAWWKVLCEGQLTPTALAEREGVTTTWIIFERQQIMLQLEKDADTLGKIAAGMLPPDKLPETAESIAKGAKDSLAAFQDRVPGGRTKPEAWTNWPDFSQRLQAFARNAEIMAQTAKSKDVVAVTSTLGDALPCKQCHDLYRAPQK